ncbi:MAG TPA: 6-phosphogluconolactonase [Gammaproteobacteria bacterium]|nr:6-phosphogluconolactonase [Gammaproteobacteria bacterium]
MDTVINHALLHILPDAISLFEAAAEDFAQRAIQAVSKKQQFNVVLSGGETPQLFYDTLVKNSQTTKIPWQKIKFFFGDERYVAADDSASNYHSAYVHLFSKLPVLTENIYPMPTDLKDPSLAALQYEQTLRQVFNSELPIFDLVYLGLGADAHTASLMPNSEVVKNYIEVGTSKLVEALWVEKLQMYRLSLTPPALNNSQCVCFLVKGEDKAPAVKEVLRGSFDPSQFPAQLIRCAGGETIWYLDEKAARSLLRETNE